MYGSHTPDPWVVLGAPSWSRAARRRRFNQTKPRMRGTEEFMNVSLRDLIQAGVHFGHQQRTMTWEHTPHIDALLAALP